MKTLAPLNQHRIFPLEIRGDTLIVAPRGDAAGFSPSEYRVEISRLGKILDRPQVKNFVVDLGAARYFGPSIIHQMIGFGEGIEARGGRVVFCEASDDMLEGLRIHNVNPEWLEPGSRRAAVRHVATVSFDERIRHNAHIWASAAAIVLLGLLFYFRPWDTRDAEYYQTYVRIWTELHELRASNPTRAEVAAFVERARGQIEPIVADLERTAISTDMAKRHLLWAGRDNLLRILDRLKHQPDRELNPYRVRTCQFEMEHARWHIERSSRFEIQLPEWPVAGVEQANTLRKRMAIEMDRI